MKTLSSIYHIIVLGLGIASLWLALSLVTSGIKVLSGECGQIYGIEQGFGEVNGSFFCPVKK